MTRTLFLLLVPILLAWLCFGSIAFALDLEPLPQPDTPYKASGNEYDDAGLGPLFNFARGFINAVLPKFPKDLVSDAMNHKLNLDIEFIKDIALHRFLGYGVALVVGILFTVLFPLIGCCFCCCRLCGKCGGNRKQEEDDGIHCQRRIMSCVVFVVVAFTITGNICTYVTNGRMSQALTKIEDTVVNNFDDVNTFLSTLTKQVHSVAGDNLDRTEQAILDHIDGNNLAEEFSSLVLKSLSQGAFDEMQKHIADLNSSIHDVEAKKGEVDAAFGTGSSSFMPGISLLTSGVQTFLGANPLTEARANIEAEVKRTITSDKIKGIKESVTKSFTNMNSTAQDLINQVDDIQQKASDNGFNVEDMKKKVKDYSGMAKTYDHYRFLAGVGLAGITSLIVALQTCGLLCGVLGQGTSTEPSKRGCVSNSGGNCLIASVAFIFLFSSLLMLLTTISFSVGSMLERFVCQPLTDLSFLELIEDKVSSLPRKPMAIIQDCKAGKSAFIAFGLESQFNISMIDNNLASAKTDIKTMMNTTFAGMNVAGNFDFNRIKTPLTQLSASLSGVGTMIGLVNSQLQDTHITPQQRAALTAFRDSLTKLTAIKTSMDGTGPAGNAWYDNFKTGLDTVGTSIHSKLPQITDQYINDIIQIAEIYVKDLKKKLKTDLGRCDPIWNLYESVVLIAFCKYTVDTFNGFWFSIGWCVFFFLPGIIFSVKLSKHFRTMQLDEDLPHNKVAPSHD